MCIITYNHRASSDNPVHGRKRGRKVSLFVQEPSGPCYSEQHWSATRTTSLGPSFVVVDGSFFLPPHHQHPTTYAEISHPKLFPMFIASAATRPQIVPPAAAPLQCSQPYVHSVSLIMPRCNVGTGYTFVRMGWGREHTVPSPASKTANRPTKRYLKSRFSALLFSFCAYYAPIHSSSRTAAASHISTDGDAALALHWQGQWQRRQQDVSYSIIVCSRRCSLNDLERSNVILTKMKKKTLGNSGI